jgi:hypothetical protein
MEKIISGVPGNPSYKLMVFVNNPNPSKPKRSGQQSSE